MKKIIVIEDNTEVRENLAEILSLSGYIVTEAIDGKDGLAKIAADKPDLILCDVMMPELDGFGVLKILNKNPAFMHIPFMFLTARAEQADFRKGMGLGADDYITKPFDDVELLEAIEIRLKKSASLQAVDNTTQGLRRFYDEAKGQREFEKLSADRELRKYAKKDLIYEAGQFPQWLYFVVYGQVKCFQTNEFGKELITQVYGPGDFFGFLPLLDEGKYENTTMAVEETQLGLIPKQDFSLLLFNNRDFAARFIKLLSHHVDHTEKQLIDLAYSSVRKKVANALLTLQEKSADSIIRVMRDDLAALAGTAKETTIRTLSDFKAEGLIEIQGKGISIKNLAGLENMPQ